MKKIKDSLLKYALQNGSKFDKVNPGSVIAKVIGDHPEAKNQIKEVQAELKKIVEEVNDLPQEARISKLKELAPELLEKKVYEKREGLKELENIGKTFVVRFAPSPSGPLHIGHSYIASLNHQYKQQYKGKLILRIEDTNPDGIDPESYKMIQEDMNWLTDNQVDEVIIQSDRMETYYSYALRLIEEGHAYVCTCPAEAFREKLAKSSSCPCRDNKENLDRWKKMLTEYNDGDAVVRFKSDIKHKNPAMRDFPLLRINTNDHVKQGKKYRVWPLMNFSVAIDDNELGITHAIRGKDHADNAKRQEMIHTALQQNTPHSVSIGRINFEGFSLSASETKLKIDNKEYDGWDDIRLPFLRAMRRRGYQPGALRKFAISMGTTQTDKKVSQDEFMKSLNAFNKEIIDPTANRYFSIISPVKIKIINAPNLQFEQDLHPDNKKNGRKFITTDEFYIEENDFRNINEGELIRLMGCLNFIKKGINLEYVSKEYGQFKGNGKKQIHWLPVDETVDIKITMPDNEVVKALAEKSIEKVEENDIIQFERFGFCRCNGKNNFWFTHK